MNSAFEMNDRVKTLSFDTVEESLARVKTTLNGASDAHGMMCGHICAGSSSPSKAWLNALIEDADADDPDIVAALSLMDDLYEYSAAQLKSMAFEFQLLIPGDYADLSLRASAIGNWCQGFMAGFGLSDMPSEDAGGELGEALFHITEIAQIDINDLDISEEDERAFTELYEYLRMAVLMIYAETSTDQGEKESIGSIH